MTKMKDTFPFAAEDVDGVAIERRMAELLGRPIVGPVPSNEEIAASILSIVLESLDQTGETRREVVIFETIRAIHAWMLGLEASFKIHPHPVHPVLLEATLVFIGTRVVEGKAG